MNSSDFPCTITFDRFALTTGTYKRSCRYHRKQGQSFRGEDLLPKGLCPHAYRVAYPYCLSLLCDARYPRANGPDPQRTVQVRCPASEHSVELTLTVRFTLSAPVRMLKRLAIRTLQAVGIGGEYPDKDVLLEVSRVSKGCPQGLKEGQVFLFNIWNRKELCPASFYALYPILIQQPGHGQALQAENCLLPCPDPAGVFYRCTTGPVNWNCEHLSLSASVVEERGTCPSGHRAGNAFSIEKMLPEGFCPLAFYAVFPYYQTLIHGGSFEWVKKGERVQVQCPKADGVVMDVELIHQASPGEGLVRARVLHNRGPCPQGLRQGDTFDLDSLHQHFCFEAMAGLIPFAGNNAPGRRYACCGASNYLLFQVE